MHDRVPGAPGQYKASVTAEELQKMQAAEAFTITLTRDDQPIAEGTPYSKAAVLPDEVAQEICPEIEDPAPADAFKQLSRTKANLINIGNYAGDLDSLDIPLNSVAWIEGGACTNCPTSSFAWLETWGSHANVRMQRITTTGGCSCQRLHYNGAWGEWDWMNPYLATGTECSTAERWNGHRVFEKVVNCGALTEGRKLVEAPSLAECVVFDVCGYVSQGNGNYTMIPSIYSQDLKSSASVSLLINTTATSGAIQIWGGSEYVGKTAILRIKYFK